VPVADEKITLSIDEAAQSLGLGRRQVFELLRRPGDPIPSFRFGRRVLIPRRELIEWAASQTKEIR
jgi:excisionase family DNA binding protein